MKQGIFTWILPLAILFTTVGCSQVFFKKGGEIQAQSFEKYLMGTIITQKIYAGDAQTVANDVFSKFQDIENRMTTEKDRMEIGLLNKLAGTGEYTPLSDDTLMILQKSKQYYEISQGAFNIAMGPLIKAWGISSVNPKIPSIAEQKQLLELSAFEDLELDVPNKKSRLKKSGNSLDLGGIAKGYAGDVAIDVYKKNGIRSGFVNLGGNIVLLGNKPDGTAWTIGIQDPRAPTGRYIGTIKVQDTAVVTSGDYERFFEQDGMRYHHILDPKTGEPARSGLIGLTVVYPISLDADALSTAVFILGPEKGRALLERVNAGGIFVTVNKEVFVTKNLASVFQMNEENKEYRYVENR